MARYLRLAQSPTSRPGPIFSKQPHARELYRFAQAVAEVLAGQRPPTQLHARMTPLAYHRLLRLTGCYQDRSCPRIRATRICYPGPQVAELCVVVNCGRRFRALALRIEISNRSWVCTRMQTA